MKILPAEAVRPVLSPRQPTEARPAPPAGGPARSFSGVLAGLGRRIDEGERVMDRAATRPGGSMEPGELLALQAQVYRHVEAVDLATKLVERATTAVKTTLQNQ